MNLDPEIKTVLLLGGSGLLGAALAPALRAAGVAVIAPSSTRCDIRDLAAVRAAVDGADVDLVINCAAQSGVDAAELEPDLAYAVNTVGAHNVALAAAAASVTLCHVSTDFVFDGRAGEPYTEDQPTGTPPNHYGRSKLQGELLVRQTSAQHFIVRVATLFGQGRRNFVTWVLADADPGAPLTIVADRFMTPTWTGDLCPQLLALLATPFFGTYHATGRGVTSWYELAREALLLAGKDPRGVVPVADVELDAAARRAPYTPLDNHMLRLRGIDRMLPWREALAQFIGGSK